jgi:hypothetical protein
VLVALKTLEKQDHCGHFAKEVAEKAHLSFPSTRGALRRLLRRNLVFQSYDRGPYSTERFNIPTSGVVGEPNLGNEGLRIHDLVLKAEGLEIEKGLKPLRFSVADVKVNVIFGSKRGKVTGFIRCDDGLSYREFCFVVSEFERRLRDALGFGPELFVVAGRLEFLKDCPGMKLEGVNCITLASFKGLWEKIYNKNYGLRHEVGVSIPLSIATVRALMMGGASAANLQQFNFMLVRQNQQVLEYQKHSMEVTRFTVPTLKAMFDAMQIVLRRLENLEEQTKSWENDSSGASQEVRSL